MSEKNRIFERRKYLRVSVDTLINATLTTDNLFQERLFIGKDISPEGLFLLTNEGVPLRTILKLKIHTPTTLEPINAEAKVIRVAKDEYGHISGIGLILTNISKEDKKELYKHLYLVYHYVVNN